MKDDRNRVSLFANYGGVHAVLRDAQPGFPYVPNVPAYVANVGIDFDVAAHVDERLFGSAYVSFIGKQNLTEDGSLTTSPYTRVTGRMGYSWASGWATFGEATWYPGNRISELAVNFGDVAHTTSDQIFVAPMPEFTVMAGLTYRFPVPTYAAPPTTKMVVK